eukprot:scaffold9_cov111-Cylindrotheca_fusiformis.AAC.2
MKGVSSGCCLPHDQPLLTPPRLCVARLHVFRKTSATRLARASPRVNRLRRFPRVGRPLRPRLAEAKLQFSVAAVYDSAKVGAVDTVPVAVRRKHTETNSCSVLVSTRYVQSRSQTYGRIAKRPTEESTFLITFLFFDTRRRPQIDSLPTITIIKAQADNDRHQSTSRKELP